MLVGCGAAVAGGMVSGATTADRLAMAEGFGFTIVAMAYGIGPISGCHINAASPLPIHDSFEAKQ